MFFWCCCYVTNRINCQSREKKFQLIPIFVEVDVLFQPSGSRTSHGQIQKVREGQRNENTRLFHSVFSHVKPPMPLKGSRNHTHTHHTWDVWSDLHLHGIISQASYEFRDDTFDGSSPEASAHNHMEIVRTQKLAQSLQISVVSRRTSGETLSPWRSCILVPPHGHLLVIYSEKSL